MTIFINTLHLQRYFRRQSTVTTTDYIPINPYPANVENMVSS